MKYSLLLLVALWAMCYLAIAFIALDFNATHWCIECRVAYVLWLIVVSLCTALFHAIRKDKNEGI